MDRLWGNQFARDLRDYAVTALRHWVAWLTGVAAALILIVLAAIHGDVPQWAYAAIIFLGFTVAQFLTWKGERDQAAKAMRALGWLTGTPGDIKRDFRLACEIGESFGVFKLTSGEMSVLILWARTALAGTDLTYDVQVVGENGQAPRVGAMHHELSVYDSAEYVTRRQLIGGSIKSENGDDLERIKTTHRHLVGRLYAEHFKP